MVQTPATSRVAAVWQVGRDTVRIMPKPGYEVSVMIGTEIEAYIIALDGTETVTMRMVAPGPTQRIEVQRADDGTVDVVYKTHD